jgi:hypothetical protein
MKHDSPYLWGFIVGCCIVLGGCLGYLLSTGRWPWENAPVQVDADSLFHDTTVAFLWKACPGDTGVAVRWPLSAGKRYTIVECDSLRKPVWPDPLTVEAVRCICIKTFDSLYRARAQGVLVPVGRYKWRKP